MNRPAAVNRPHPAIDFPPDEAMPLVHGCGTGPFGPWEMVWSGRWLLRFGFTDDPGGSPGRWSDAGLRRDDDASARLAASIFEGTCPLRPWLKGSVFQEAVWRALLTVPRGGTVSYARLAAMAGHPQAARAVGSAVAANPIAVIVPCHRVVRCDGSTGGYRWGTTRKAALLAWERR